MAATTRAGTARLTVEDVRAIFFCVTNDRPPPPHLPFKIINAPTPATGARLLPPSSEFKDGTYILCDKPNDPSSPPEGDATRDAPPSGPCRWTMAGPRLKQPTDVQQRPCQPKDATTEYARSRRGDIWTMVGANGTDNLEYRLFHVFPSMPVTKTAPLNKPSLNALRLSLKDVRDVFESVHNNGPPPANLSFKVIAVGSNDEGLVSPPQTTFDEGLYILMKHENAPDHLVDLVQEVSSAPCRWRLAGTRPPQFFETKTIQMRSCIPEKGNQRGDLWTVYGADGKESLEYRLFHIYAYAGGKLSPPLVKSKPLSKRVVKKSTLLTSPPSVLSDKNSRKRTVDKRSESVTEPSSPTADPFAARLSEDNVRDLFASILYNQPPPTDLPFQVVPPGLHDVHVVPPPVAFDDGLYILIKNAKVPLNVRNHVMEYIPSTKCPWNLLDTKLKQDPSVRCRWKIAGPRFPLPTRFQMRSCASETGDRRGDLWTMYGANGEEIMEYRIFHVYPTKIRRIIKKPEPTTVKKPLAKRRAAKKVPSLVSPRVSRTAAAASQISPSVPRLNFEDVQGIFERVRNKNRPPPPHHLPFKVVAAEPNAVLISPPRFAFDDGLYLLMMAQKKKKKTDSNKRPSIPSHLLDYVLEIDPSTPRCRWKIAGPRYSLPTPVQVRSCTPEHGGQRGELFTMYDSDGNEDFEFRLFHVFSNSVGVDSSPNAEKKHNKGCIRCRRDSDYDKLMICESCERECHTYCLGLKDVPEGDWFCANCTKRMAKATANGNRKRSQPAQAAHPAKKSSRVSSMVSTESDLSEEGPPASVSRPGLPRSVSVNVKRGGKHLTEHFYCKLTKRQIDALGNELDEHLGFVRLESRNATFSDARAAIQEEMDPESLPENSWKFYLPPIGPVSKRQEQSFGSVSSFLLEQEFEGRLGDGSLDSPFNLYLLV